MGTVWFVQWSSGHGRAFCSFDCAQHYLNHQKGALLARSFEPEALFTCTACFVCAEPIDAPNCVVCGDGESEHYADAWECTVVALWVGMRLNELLGRALEPEEWEAVLDASYDEDVENGQDGPAVLRAAYLELTGEELTEEL